MKRFFLLSLSLLITTIIFSQESSFKSYEKIHLSAGYEGLNYPGYGINTQGYRLQLDLPIYERLGATVAYSNHSVYQDYCDDIPVTAATQYYTVGLNYTFYERSNWSFVALAGLDVERVRYRELGHVPSQSANLHNERVHESELDNHSEVMVFVEGVLGLEVKYHLTEHLQFNFTSRINTYGAFRNSFGLGYSFNFNKKDRVVYFK